MFIEGFKSRAEATVAGQLAYNTTQEPGKSIPWHRFRQKRVHLNLLARFRTWKSDIVDFKQEQRRVAALAVYRMSP